MGLVVSPPALVKGQAVPSQNVADLQQRLLAVVANPPTSAWGGDDDPAIDDLAAFLRTVLGWSLDDLAGAPGGPPIPEGLELVLPDYQKRYAEEVAAGLHAEKATRGRKTKRKAAPASADAALPLFKDRTDP